MKTPRFVEKDVAASRTIWWDLYQHFQLNYRNEYRSTIESGLRSFLSKYYDTSKTSVPRCDVIQVLLHIKLKYTWAKRAFDGGEAYKKTNALIKRLERIGGLAEQLAIECEDTEALYFVGNAALNPERLSGLRDSLGKEHNSIETFAGGLISRVCIDATVLAEGLTDVRQRTKHLGGRPPVISNTYLILTGMDLYENLFQLGDIVAAAPPNPTGPQDYTGDFFDFIRCYTAVLAKEDFAISKGSTGFGSSVVKTATLYRKDRELPKGLNPTSDVSSLLLSINTMASLSSFNTRLK